MTISREDAARDIAKELDWPWDWREHVNEPGAWGLKECWDALISERIARMEAEDTLSSMRIYCDSVLIKLSKKRDELREELARTKESYNRGPSRIAMTEDWP